MQSDPSRKPSRAIVTGAAGFLGRHAARALSDAGFEVVGMGIGEISPEDHAWSKMLRYYDTPIAPDALRELFQTEGQPALIFHAAGGASVGVSWRDPEADRRNTLGGTQILLDAIADAAADIRFIFASSAAVYGDQKVQPIPETAAYAPISPYGEHKMMAEQACLAAAAKTGMSLSILRFFSLYGPHLRKQILWDLLHRLAGNPSEIQLGGFGTETRDFLHVSDAAKLITLTALGKQAVPTIMNGGTGISTTVRELAETVIREAGLTTRVTFSQERPRGDPIHLVAQTDLASNFGFTPDYSVQRGLKDYIAWAKSVMASQ